jgi:hypothetical protein
MCLWVEIYGTEKCPGISSTIVDDLRVFLKIVGKCTEPFLEDGELGLIMCLWVEIYGTEKCPGISSTIFMVFFEDLGYFQGFNRRFEFQRKKREDYTSTSRPSIKSPKCSHGSKASFSVYLGRC